MHSMNITRCIKLNDRPDGIIHWIEVWWVRWPHDVTLVLWSVIRQSVYETRVHDTMSCDSIYCMCGAAWSSDWLMAQLTAVDHGDHACVRASGGHFEHYFVTINLFSLYSMNFVFHTMFDAACIKIYKNRSRLSRVIITNVLPPFYGSQCNLVFCKIRYTDRNRTKFVEMDSDVLSLALLLEFAKTYAHLLLNC